MENSALERAKSKLLSADLTKTEVEILICLFKQTASANEISKDLGMNRTFVYDRLKRLMSSGFVSELTEEGKKKFRANKKEIIINAYKEESAIKENFLEEALTLLDKLSEKEKKNLNVDLFTGKKSIFSLLNQIIREEPEQIFIIGSLKTLAEKMDYYFENFDKRRNEKKIKIRLVTNDYVELKNLDIEFIEEEQLSTNLFYKDKSILIIWTEQPTALYIQNKDFARTNIKMIESMFNREVKIYDTKEGIEYAYMQLLAKKNSVIGSWGYMSGTYRKIYSDEFADKWQLECKKRGIKIYSIHNEEEEIPSEMKQRFLKHGVVIRRLLPNHINGPTAFQVSEEYTMQIMYALEKPRVLLIRNKELARINIEHFEKLWKMAKK